MSQHVSSTVRAGQLTTATLQAYLLLTLSNTDMALNRLHTEKLTHTFLPAALTKSKYAVVHSTYTHTHTQLSSHEGVVESRRTGQHTAHINNELTRRPHNSAH